ncbi:MAG TPA: serine/threonine-protein kinase, partial [Pirellulales bacterium]|nr:serine/threonine-protein kinase [Pirellulales bacterium]
MDEESIFHEALARSSCPEREKFLDEACAGQPALRAAVEALLAADDEPGEFLGGPLLAVGDFHPEGGGAGPSGETWTHDGTADPESRRLDPLQPPGTPTKTPTQIGRYEVRRLLGRGGMGAVYLAHDPELDRLVALKVPELLSGGAEERFLREARAAAAVSHPNLCPVYDAGRSDGVLYLAMAYVEGSTLTELLKQAGSLAPARAAALAIGIARGMAEAHRHGIVHRDLKPGNVLLGRLGEPVVTDFGLALREAGSGPSENAKRAVEFEPRLTHPGILMGTPTYMPPEQACGDLEQVGPASDIYSLGAILYE